MIKQYCDRCGKELPKPIDRWYYRHREYYETRIIGIPIREHDNTSEYELCRECSDSQAHWFMEGRMDKEEQ